MHHASQKQLEPFFANGKPRASIVTGYKPSLIPAASYLDHRVLFTLMDIQRMRQDPMIKFGLRMLFGPIYRAKWKVTASDGAVGKYVDKTLKHIWNTYLHFFLRSLVFGSAGGETIYDLVDGEVAIHEIREYHLNDLRPLVDRERGEQVGVSIRGTGYNQASPVRCFRPRYWWLTNEAEFGFYHGKSVLAGAWLPWVEKTNKRGALDARRLWFVKNAFDGGVMRHPLGTLDMGDGTVRHCQDYAREILEKKETGGILTLPNTRDETGNYQWEYTPPGVNGRLDELREYPKDLDQEILTGLGIPPEVIQASESGSGYAGRAIPALMFWVSEDVIVRTLIAAMDRHIVRPLVAVNYSPKAQYQIEPESLVPQDPQQQPQTGNSGLESLLGDLGGSGDEQQQGGQQPPAKTQMSGLTGDPAMDQFARHLDDLLHGREPATAPQLRLVNDRLKSLNSAELTALRARFISEAA